jgi:hypothetical protein
MADNVTTSFSLVISGIEAAQQKAGANQSIAAMIVVAQPECIH